MLCPTAITMRTRIRHSCQAMLAVPALLILVSCAAEEDGLGKRYPVSGTVTYNGQPLEKGDIAFVAEDMKSNFGAGGTIVKGEYKLSTGGNNDGAAAGKYKVLVTSREEFSDKAKAEFQKATGLDNPKLPPHMTAKAQAEAKSLIPPGYGDTRTTTLTAEVKPESNTLNFTLSDTDAPPPPPAPTTKGKGGHRG